MLKRILFGLVFLMTLSVNAYTPDVYTNVTFNLPGAFTPDSYLNVTFDFAPEITDTCSCPGLNQSWNVSMADNCNIVDDCDLGTGKLTFYATGTFICNATINTTGMGNPPAISTLYVKDYSNCLLDTFD